jgi:hypothetical protein
MPPSNSDILSHLSFLTFSSPLYHLPGLVYTSQYCSAYRLFKSLSSKDLLFFTSPLPLYRLPGLVYISPCCSAYCLSIIRRA